MVARTDIGREGHCNLSQLFPAFSCTNCELRCESKSSQQRLLSVELATTRRRCQLVHSKHYTTDLLCWTTRPRCNYLAAVVLAFANRCRRLPLLASGPARRQSELNASIARRARPPAQRSSTIDSTSNNSGPSTSLARRMKELVKDDNFRKAVEGQSLHTLLQKEANHGHNDSVCTLCKFVRISGL